MKRIKLNSNLFRFIIIIISVIVTLLVLEIPTAPYVYIGLIWIITILFLSLNSKRNFVKLLGINLSAVILALTIFEAYIWFERGEFFVTVHNTLPHKIDNVLGYAPKKEQKVTETGFYKDKLIWDATITINENGLRITPLCNDSAIKGSALFFGCSFTYGFGVNDSETMPYQVGIKSKGKYCIYNFGFRGYGPHQMLSELEHNTVKNIVNNKGKIYAVYQTIGDHIRRVAGLTWWDEHGPRYILGNNGEVKFAGNFDDTRILPAVIIKYLKKSLLYRDIIVSKRFFNDDKDLELFLGIVYAAKKNFERVYPKGEFHVIIWDVRFESDMLEKVLDYFQVSGINVHLITTILPDYQYNEVKYILSPYDDHPNALTHRLIAEYITNNILK